MKKEIIFKAEKLNKNYPGTKALQDVSMEIHKGEVIGLIGENGAGKSTLLKMIMGVEQLTNGSMTMNNIPYKPLTPKDANKSGIGMVFQEQSLITNLTVGQNMFFGKESSYKRFGLIHWKKMYADASRVLKDIDLQKILPETKVEELDFASRQMVEIAKVLNSVKGNEDSASLILLDEPTSVLNDEEIRQLFSEIKHLKENGDAVIFISHRLDEVLEIADRIYIFKDGEQVGHFNRNEAEESLLYEKMVGRNSTGEYYQIDKQSTAKDSEVLNISKLGLLGHFKDVSFSLMKGEVLGIAGVVGSGKEKLCSVLSGDEYPSTGEISIRGKKEVLSSPFDALNKGILSIPKERRQESIAGSLSILENISLSNLNNVTFHGLISRRKQIEKSQEWIDRLRIKCSGYEEQVCQLSGGNAQKVVFSRVLDSSSDILIFNHPTRGVDVGAKEDIYNLIREITAKGISVILLGDSMDECIGLSNRILVMKDGLITNEFDAPAENKPEQVEIVKFMM